MTDSLHKLATSVGLVLVEASNEANVASIEAKAGLCFPPLFRQMLTKWNFESFVLGEVDFFGNSPGDGDGDIGIAMFIDPILSPALIKAGLLQVGRPATGSYDAICFNMAQQIVEPELLQVDHESVLCFGKIQTSKVIARDFAELINRHAGNADHL